MRTASAGARAAFGAAFPAVKQRHFWGTEMFTGLKTKASLRGALLMGASALIGAQVLGVSAAAQDATPPADPAVSEKVIVTGSRIPRTGFNTSTPLSIVTGNDVRKSGFSLVADAIQAVPSIGLNQTLQSSPPSIIAIGATADIRGLGGNRTLILVNGRRHVPGSTTGSSTVDLNMISPSMVKRVEVITGGTSAIYGSDAVAGVVNIILRDDLEGAEFDVQSGISEYGDANEVTASMVLGGKFADGKGYMIGGIEYGHVDGLIQKDREELYPGISRYPATVPQQIITRQKSQLNGQGVFRFSGAPLGGALSSTSGNVNSFLLTANHAFSAITDPNCRSTAQQAPPGTNGVLCQNPHMVNTNDYVNLQGEVEYWNARAYGTYDLDSNIQAFAEFSFNHQYTTSLAAQPGFSQDGGGQYFTRIRFDNFYLNDPLNATALAAKAAFTAAGVTGLGVGGGGCQNNLTTPDATNANNTCSSPMNWFSDVLGQRNNEQYRDTMRTVIGLKGDFNAFGADVAWDTYYQYGRLAGQTRSNGLANLGRIKAAFDVIDGPAPGRDPVCRDNPNFDEFGTNPACVPWDFINGPSQAAINYVKATGSFISNIEQHVAGLNFQTDLFETWAGPVAVAFGGEYRRDEANFDPDDLVSAGLISINQIPQTKGTTSVIEAYVEAVVPILSDVLFFKQLNLEGAARTADYNTAGVVNSYRYGFDWVVLDDLRFRGSQATSTRAPNVGELYGPQSENFTNAVTDPCSAANYAAASPSQQAARSVTCAFFIPGWTPAFVPSSSSLRLRQGGNPNLNAETAESKQIGMVIKPSFIDGFQFSVDYWEVELTGAVASVSAADTLRLCYDTVPPAPGANPICNSTVRDLTGVITGTPGSIHFILQSLQNISTFFTKGIDLAMVHNFDLANYVGGEEGSLGQVSLRAAATYVDKFTIDALPGAVPSEFAGWNPGSPQWQGTSSVAWTFHDLTLSWNTLYIGSTLLGAKPAYIPGSRTLDEVGLYTKHDVRFLYDWTDNIQLRGGVLNALDKYPTNIPEIYQGTGAGTTGAFDNRGRFFYLGVTYAVN
jgi:outer membrane receptor protein involved in Fe transport